MPVSLRPGIYSSYEVSTDLSAEAVGLRIGIAAAAPSAGECVLISSLKDAQLHFGSSSSMTKLIKSALLNGAAEILACPVTDAEYAAAFKRLVEDDGVDIILCDDAGESSRSALKTALENASEQHRYKLGILELGGTANELAQAAQALNCERMLICANTQKDGAPGAVAAALAGKLAASSDPTRSFNGAVLEGIGELDYAFTDAQTELLIRSGLTPIESEAGEISVVRAVTTRTSSAGAYDSSWRDIGVILCVNNVLPAVRNALLRRFAQSKNNAQTRSAIRTQVMIELENWKKRGIIAGYGKVKAEADKDDPELCRVSFEFSVSRGLNTIELIADVKV